MSFNGIIQEMNTKGIIEISVSHFCMGCYSRQCFWFLSISNGSDTGSYSILKVRLPLFENSSSPHYIHPVKVRK